MNQLTIQVDKQVMTFYKTDGVFTETFLEKDFSAKKFKTIKRLIQKSSPTACGFEFSVTPVSMDFLEVHVSFFA